MPCPASPPLLPAGGYVPFPSSSQSFIQTDESVILMPLTALPFTADGLLVADSSVPRLRTLDRTTCVLLITWTSPASPTEPPESGSVLPSTATSQSSTRPRQLITRKRPRGGPGSKGPESW